MEDGCYIDVRLLRQHCEILDRERRLTVAMLEQTCHAQSLAESPYDEIFRDVIRQLTELYTYFQAMLDTIDTVCSNAELVMDRIRQMLENDLIGEQANSL